MKVISRKEAQERGLKRYFTGKPCKRGHVAERQVSNWVCLECDNTEEKRADRAATAKEWRENNRDYKNAYRRLWSKENKDKLKKYRQTTTNKAYRREVTAKRRALKKGWSDNWTPTEKLAVNIIYEEASLLGSNFEVDHIVPLAKGGSHTADNLQIITKAHHAPKLDKVWQDRKYV